MTWLCRVPGALQPAGGPVLTTSAQVEPGMSGGPVLIVPGAVLGVVRGQAQDGNPVSLVAPVSLLAEALKAHAGTLKTL